MPSSSKQTSKEPEPRIADNNIINQIKKENDDRIAAQKLADKILEDQLSGRSEPKKHNFQAVSAKKLSNVPAHF